MVRENRVKSYIFPIINIIGSNFDTISDNPINGDVLKVRVENITSPGSLFVQEDGINIWSRLNITSGLSKFDVYPKTYSVNELNTTGSPLIATNLSVSNHISLTGSGFTSGTNKTFGPITIFYR
jgi:hypothetical protein